METDQSRPCEVRAPHHFMTELELRAYVDFCRDAEHNPELAGVEWVEWFAVWLDGLPADDADEAPPEFAEVERAAYRYGHDDGIPL